MKNQKKLYITYFVMMFAVILTMISTAQAVTFTVNTPLDSHDPAPGDGVCGGGAYPICSLRAAIEEANSLPGSDFILFSNSFKAPNPPKTIVLKYGQLEIKSDLAINGPGARQLMIDGDGKSRVLFVKSGAPGTEINVLIAFLTIQNGYQYVPVFVTQGAGILNWSNLALSQVTIRNNVGMGDDLAQSEQGGGIANQGFLNIEHSTVSGNKAGIGAGIYNNGVLYAYNSTISDNNSLWGGAGIFNSGDEVWIRNTTIANNFAQTEPGGGIANPFNLPFHMANTIVANNFAPFNKDINGNFNSDGNNLVKSRGGSSGYVASDLPDGTNPLLGVLKNNGGPTDTHAIVSGSPATDAGNDCVVAVPNCSGDFWYDQRGYGFPRKIGSSVDIGAFESSPKSNFVQISGIVLKPNGRGLNKALVNITDDQGRTRSAETDQHGNFSFDNVAVDESYEIKVESQRYEYAPQTLRAAEDRADVKFVPIGSAEPPDTE